MAKVTLAQAAAWCGGYVQQKYEQIEFDGASNDSRTIAPGQLFVALLGARDGNAFIPAAMQKGAAAVLTSRLTDDCPAIVVPDARIALGRIAAGERQALGMTVVGVTGSVGKSTTKEMIAAVLEGDYLVGKTPENFNNDLGLPMAILGMQQGTQVGVLEMGMSHFSEISYLSGIARPDIGVITNIGTMHIENLGSREGILRAKMEITDGMKDTALLCLNGDDPYLWGQHERVRQKVFYFGVDKAACPVRAVHVQPGEKGISFCVVGDGIHFPVELALEGEHYVADALAAVTVGLAMGVTPENIAGRLGRFCNMAGRQEIFEAKGCTIIKDCYNAGPESMEAALKVLGDRNGRRIAVLGDMLELGTHTQQAHEQVGAQAARYADVLLCYGPNGSTVAATAQKMGLSQACAFTDRAQLAQYLQREHRPGDVLLFKGSHGMHMEQVLELFLGE